MYDNLMTVCAADITTNVYLL